MRSADLPRFLFALALGAALLGLAAALRGPEYDESYTAFVTARVPRPDWPSGAFRVGAARPAFTPAPTPWGIDRALRMTDVHPPLYFWTVWAWRRLFGPGLLASRLLSVGFSVAALACVAAIAVHARIPPWPSLALTLGCYGFVETGVVARGYAMAQCLLLIGLLLTLKAAPPRPLSRLRLLAAGAALGGACFANYLAAFPAAAAVLWSSSGRPRGALPLLCGLTPFALADLPFFLAQRQSRIGQFAPFSWHGMAAGMAHALGGAILGGLPLYLDPGPSRLLAEGLLGLGLVALLLVPVLRWPRLGRPGPRRLLALAAAATPVGLLLLARASNSLPIEIRYLAFALPPLALLLAAGLCSLARRRRRLALAALLTVQAASIIGLLTRPETMQPEGAAARAAFRAVGTTGLVLLPRGNDGVGIVGAFLTAAPDGLHLLLVQPQSQVADLLRVMRRWPRVAGAEIAADQASAATLPVIAAALAADRQMR